MDSWITASGQIDSLARLIVAVLLGIWLLIVGLRFDAEYPQQLIEIAGQPWWRLLMVIAALSSAYWCPRVGVLAALAVIVYLADLRALTTV